MTELLRAIVSGIILLLAIIVSEILGLLEKYMNLILIFIALFILWDASMFFFPEWHNERIYKQTINNTSWNRK